tara:strand:+ start:148 stop:813 length:666 start_codon:yes stop_codon:yes gene_type:complete
MVLGLLGGAAKGIGRDLAMGFGVSERDEDYFNRTRETLRRQYGDARADLYDKQTAAQRAAAPRGRVKNPKRSEKGILGTIFEDLTLGLPNRGRSTRSTGRSSSPNMSSSLRPKIRPMMGVPQSADLIDFPLVNMQRRMSGITPLERDALGGYGDFSISPMNRFDIEPDQGITGVGDPVPVTSGLIPNIPTIEDFLDALGVEDTLENRKMFATAYVESMGGY